MNDFQTQWSRLGPAVLRAVERVGRSGYLILGKEVTGFEAALAEYWKLPYAVGCANGLDALEIGLRILGLNPGDKVLTTPLSAFATSLAIIRAGGVPVFADVDESGLLDLELAEQVLEKDKSVRFLVPVHLYGHCLDLERLEKLRNRYELKIIEDCAQSIGASWNGRVCGAVGQVTATSFYPTKNLGCMGDGGALLTSHAELAAEARTLRDYGQSVKYIHSKLGMNSRLDELQAALLHDAMLPALDEQTAHRRSVAERYRSGISNPKLQFVPVPEKSDSVWHLFPVLVSGNRADFQKHLADRGVASGQHYPKLISDQEALLRTGPADVRTGLERARDFAERQVSLPIHPFLSDTQIEQVIEACNSW